ncbi:hypothetical protein [Marinagarivorans algicola]|uniref:hypothetical protein n=1 Tax=Marinagarivorans algicola TaxID=1513270 RepID=UPI003735B9C8
MLTFNTDRQEYRDLMRGYFPDVEPVQVNVPHRLLPTVPGLLKTIRALYRAIRSTYPVKGLTISDYLLSVLAFSFTIRIIDELESKQLKCSKYVAFNSSYMCESAISFYFRSKGIPTASLQHGMYAEYVGAVVPMDVINYENVCAEELWVWGQYSKLEVSNLAPSDCNIVVKGYPFWKQAEKKRCSKAVYVLLPRDIYIHESYELLEMLASYQHDYEFIVRPHPSALPLIASWIESHNANFQLESGVSLNKQLESVEFHRVIAFNSTAIFESILMRQKIIVFNKNSEFDCSAMPTFSDSVVLNQLLQVDIVSVSSEHFFLQYELSLG